MKKYKKKCIIVLKKSFIVLLGVVLILPCVIYFSSNTVNAAVSPFNKSSSYYVLSFSEDERVSGASNNNDILISWRPSLPDYNIIEVVTVEFTDSSGNTKVSLRLALNGADNITYHMESASFSISSSKTTVTSNYNYQYDISEAEFYNTMTTDFNNLTINGLMLRNYDLDLFTIPAYSYFIRHNASVIPGVQTNNFIGNDIRFLDYPVIIGYDNTHTIANGNYLGVYVTEPYVLIIATNSGTALFGRSTYISNPDYLDVERLWFANRQVSNTTTIQAVCVRAIPDPEATGAASEYGRWMFYVTNDSYNTLATTQYFPLYYGPLSTAPSDIMTILGRGAGASTNELNESNEIFNTEVENLNDIEDDFISDFETNINNIDLTNAFQNNTSFLSSANWVRSRFNELTLNNPFGSLLTFSMIIGLALLLIGRIL